MSDIDTDGRHPAVSVIMPAYNAAQLIEQAIQSVREQTFTDWELVVADDCSADETRAIVERHQRQDPRIRLVALDTNLGTAGARNQAIQNSRGKYLAFLDSDDRWSADKLAIQIPVMEREGLDLCFGSYEVCDEAGRTISERVCADRDVSYREMLFDNPAGCLTVVVNHEKHPSIRFSDRIQVGEDLAAWLSIARNGGKVRSVSQTLGAYRLRRGGNSFNKLRAARDRWILLRQIEKLPRRSAWFCLAGYAQASLPRWLANVARLAWNERGEGRAERSTG